ncbi:MAG: choline-sulfatase [Gammaproteobacteria bacterium]|jgi:choline-sulfatase
MASKKPNVLIIQADQMAPQALPIHGHPLVKTPNIQALADQGVVFDNAYCNFPLCVPSRYSMLTGRHTSTIAAWDNAVEMASETPTLAHYMRDLGYDTTLCGKMHFIGPDQLHGFSQRLTTDIYPSNFAWTPDWPNEPEYRPTGISLRPVVEAGQCVRSLQIDYDDEVEFYGVQKIHDIARHQGDDPFCLFVSFTHPHSPFVTTAHYWDQYRHDDVDLPKVAAIDVDKLDEHSRWLYYAHGTHLNTVTEEHLRNARHAYYGMCTYIDDKVGQLMAAMRATGLDDNTIVIFISDHGEMLGERGMWYKQSFFEWSTRVPMIVSQPGTFAPARVSELVSLADLVPTLIDLGSGGKPTEPVDPFDGASLTGLLSGNAQGWSNEVVSEYTGEGIKAPCRMLRRGRYKYMYTHGFPGMLYDLDSDPDELHNLVDEPAFAEVAKQMLDGVLDGWDPVEVNEQCLESQRRRRFVHGATGGVPYWAYEARPEDKDRFVRNAGAAPTKAKARFPYVEPTPFEQ